MYSLPGDLLSQTLFIFYLLTSHSLTVLSGGGLVTKSCLTFVTPWTIAGKVPLSMRFSRKEYWSGLPFPSPAKQARCREIAEGIGARLRVRRYENKSSA